MATKITPAEAALQVQLGLTLGSKNYGFTYDSDTTGIVEGFAKTVNVPYSSEKVVFNADSIDNSSDLLDYEYLTIINQDDKNTVRIRLNNGKKVFDYPIKAGRFSVLPFDQFSGDATGTTFSAYTRMTEVSAQADTSNVDIEITAYRR